MTAPRRLAEESRVRYRLEIPPSGRASVSYRVMVGLLRGLARWVFDLRVELRGAEHLPRDPSGRVVGGWIAAPVPHVRWLDPLLLMIALPVEPRPMFFGSGPAIFMTPFRRLLVRLAGNVVPVWPGGGRARFDSHVAAAEQVIRAGAVFVIYPEGHEREPPLHPPVPEPRRIEPGFGYMALRTGAAIVPIILGGTAEVHRGRRFVVDVLPPRGGPELAGLPTGDVPEPGSADEREAAHRIAAAYNALTQPLVEAQFADDVAHHASSRRRWAGMTHWFEPRDAAPPGGGR